ncbi:hypothetical protein NLG97_g6623 [Lecanicillium saksenae]|uniref:Uncharacterized protein n=1 Tax=Lecanicillium saksenae TaxID=468837 RepID=A0ACC1QSX3_9HYPO|nr:hypothetical protein NLG97_g6623 [Lecanicillium saksenae]
MLSISCPGPEIVPDEEQAQLCRDANEFARDIRDKYPDRYGFFAMVPSLMDTAAALEEIRYAFDVLGADGVTLYTRYGKGNNYLGHPNFAPVWEELHRREAVVFVHPTDPIDANNKVNEKLLQPILDFPHETTRTAVDLIMTDSVRKYSRCKIILSHGGGSLPYLAARPAMLLHDTGLTNMTSEYFLESARMFYYDTALTDPNLVLPFLLKFASADHILFGTDVPYAPDVTVKRLSRDLDEVPLSRRDRDKIEFGTALKLFPRLAHLR